MELNQLKLELVRIFVGDSSWKFLLELMFRTACMYAYALVLVRLLGKRGLGALAPFELTVIIALGSALGDPMLMRDVPLLHGMVVVTMVVALQRLFVHLTEKNRSIEFLAQSTAERMVKHGIIETKTLHEEGFSREDLFLSLREAGVEQLGQVKKAFLETNGRVSVWKFAPQEARPGILLLPETDDDTAREIQAPSKAMKSGFYSCCHCGRTDQAEEGSTLLPCPLCGNKTLVPSSIIGVEKAS